MSKSTLTVSGSGMKSSAGSGKHGGRSARVWSGAGTTVTMVSISSAASAVTAIGAHSSAAMNRMLINRFIVGSFLTGP